MVEPLAVELGGTFVLNETVTKQPTKNAVKQKPIFIFAPPNASCCF
jgi:hypothetical protein